MAKTQKDYSISDLQKKANNIRADIIKMLEKAGSGHSAGPLGLADIFTALYFKVLKQDPENPEWEERDILVLDEWAAEQDPTFRAYFYQVLIRDLRAMGKTIIAVTHDDAYFDCADRVIRFDYGRISPAGIKAQLCILP